MRFRTAVACVALALAMGAPVADAKTKPQVVDPKGDSLAGYGPIDVLSVEYSTSGTGSGRKYVPKKLLVTLTLAAPPDTSGLVSYLVVADVDMCGPLRIRFAPGAAASSLVGNTYATFGSCAEYLFFDAKLKGSVVTFDFALKRTGIDRGSALTDFQVSVDGSEPVVGDYGTGAVRRGLADAATGDGTWIVP